MAVTLAHWGVETLAAKRVRPRLHQPERPEHLTMTRPPTADLPLTVPWAAGSAVATPRVCAVVADIVRSAVLERVKAHLRLDDEVAEWLRALQVGAGVYQLDLRLRNGLRAQPSRSCALRTFSA